MASEGKPATAGLDDLASHLRTMARGREAVVVRLACGVDSCAAFKISLQKNRKWRIDSSIREMAIK